MLTYEDCVAFSGNTNYSVAAPIPCRDSETDQAMARAQDASDNSVPSKAPLRSYAANTGLAQARLLALTLLADGQMDPREVAVLCSEEGLRRLGLTNKQFFQVLYDFCSDVSRMPAAGGSYNIPRAGLTTLLDEVSDPALRKQTLNLMLDVVSADGKFDHGEATLLWNVLEAWDPSGKETGRRTSWTPARPRHLGVAVQH